MNIDKLKELKSKATTGAISVGRTLRTRETANWSPRQLERSDAIEARLVFVNFHEIDEGKSRQLVAQFQNESDAVLYVETVNNLDALLEVVEAAKKWKFLVEEEVGGLVMANAEIDLANALAKLEE